MPYTQIPDGYSLIVSSFCHLLPHEKVNTKYNFIYVWEQLDLPRSLQYLDVEVNTGALGELDLNVHYIAIVHIGNEFRLAELNQKTKYKNVTYPVPPPAFCLENEEDDDAFPVDSDEEQPLADKDEQEKKDPDFHKYF